MNYFVKFISMTSDKRLSKVHFVQFSNYQDLDLDAFTENYIESKSKS